MCQEVTIKSKFPSQLYKTYFSIIIMKLNLLYNKLKKNKLHNKLNLLYHVNRFLIIIFITMCVFFY